MQNNTNNALPAWRVPFSIRYFTGAQFSIVSALGLPSDFYRDNGTAFVINEKYRTPELDEKAVEHAALTEKFFAFRKRQQDLPCGFGLSLEDARAALSEAATEVAISLATKTP